MSAFKMLYVPDVIVKVDMDKVKSSIVKIELNLTMSNP